MRTVYNSIALDYRKRINSATTRLSLWGCPVEIGLKFYNLGIDGTVVNFSVRPLNPRSSFDVNNCIHKYLAIQQGYGSRFRYIEQDLVVRPFFGTVLGKSILDSDESVYLGRDVSKAFLDVFASIFETIRRSIYRHLSKPIMDLCFDNINQMYGPTTTNNIKGFLSNLHWDLLLAGSDCRPETLQVIKTTVANNFPRHFAIQNSVNNDLAADLPVYRGVSVDANFLANWKASELLRVVCGQEKYDEFTRYRQISFETQGYSFAIKPGEMISCKDAYGGYAKICVHTVNFMVNPIDELSIDWLYIHDDLQKFFNTANVFRRSGQFCTDVAKNDACATSRREEQQNRAARMQEQSLMNMQETVGAA